MAAAIRHARGLVRMEQVEFAAALSRAGCPATKHMVSRWELGADAKWGQGATNGAQGRVTIVPGYALVAAAKVAKVTVSKLLAMAGAEPPEAVPDIGRIRRRQEMIEEALNELRAERGLPPLPVIDEEAVD